MVEINEFPGYFIDEGGTVIGPKGKPISSFVDSGGRVRVQMRKDGKMYKRAVSRLVAEAFIPNPENKPQVDHRDGNRSNNNASNLRWVTNLENQMARSEQGNSNDTTNKKVLYDGIEYVSIHELSRILSRQRGNKPETVRKAIHSCRYGEITLYGKKCKMGD